MLYFSFRKIKKYPYYCFFLTIQTQEKKNKISNKIQINKFKTIYVNKKKRRESTMPQTTQRTCMYICIYVVLINSDSLTFFFYHQSFVEIKRKVLLNKFNDNTKPQQNDSAYIMERFMFLIFLGNTGIKSCFAYIYIQLIQCNVFSFI